MNRGHDFSCFLDALERLNFHNIPVCAHIILGLPWENRVQMMETCRQIARLPLQGIKIHSLYIVKGSPLALIWNHRPEQRPGLDNHKQYDEQNPAPLSADSWRLLSCHEYVALIADTLEILPPDFLIHRLTGDGKYQDVIAPEWTLAKWELLNAIDRELERRDSWQGKKQATSNQ
jgi:radical SAM superfamily enzyme